MVKKFVLKTDFFLKGELVLAITAVVLAFLFSANFALAAKTKISDEEVERVKIALDIVQTASNIGGILLDGGNIKTVLSTVIKGGQTATDVTYGLLVLSAINEMEFMDMVLSQAYKDEAREYFTRILDERTSLRFYWKGVGFDIPRVLSGRITSPMAALTLNTFEMTDKIILIFSAFKNLQTELRYDGLWYYFDFRRGGDSHEDAWNFARWHMQWAGSVQLESQFSTLYDKWSPYATSYGISKEYKEQLASELRATLATAIEERTDDSPLYAEEPSLWNKITAQLINIKNTVAQLVSQVNPFSAGPIDLPIATIDTADTVSIVDTVDNLESAKLSLTGDAELPGVDAVGPATSATEEQADVGFPPISELPAEIKDIGYPLLATTTEVELEPTPTPEPTPAPTPTPEPEPITIKSQLPLIELCKRGEAGAARQYRVLINEIAWMGSQDSPNDEWIELKNIWGLPINLNGWQLQDKNQQIKIIFGENDTILPQGYFLLERGKNYKGALNNSNEALYLFDNNCQLEDEVVANPKWPAGDSANKKSMQRFDVLYWYTGISSANSENSSPPAVLTHPSAPSPAPKAAASKLNYLKIFITEARTGSPGNEKDDFVELYNPNAESVSLTDWYIQRKTETGHDFSSYAPAGLFSGKTIQAKDYFLISNASSTLTTSTDIFTTYSLTENNALVLKNPNGEVVDQISTASPPPAKSYGRKWSTTTENYIDNFENQKPTPKVKNESLSEEGGGGGGGGVPALSVVINEIAWMGTKSKSQDEWIELFNNTTSTIDLTNWRLFSADGGPDITFPASTTIPANGYFLIERTDNTTLSDISADWYGPFGSGLSNNGETLELRDSSDSLIDSVDFSSGWPAGQASPNYISMERISSTTTASAANWAINNRISKNGRDASNNYINGTPKVQNSVSKSSTEINGLVLNENITMTRLGSPYIINSSYIEVQPNVTLMIESGVTVKFNGGTKMLVHGNMIAQGTSQNQIIFTSITDSDPENNGGYYIYFDTAGANSTLDNVIVRYGGYYINASAGYRAALTLDNATATISNSVIENNFFAGLYLIGSNSLIQNTIFRDNKDKYTDWGYGSYSRGLSFWNSMPIITGSSFERNYHGIFTEDANCPDLSGVSFGTSTNSNTYNITPESCAP